MIVRIAMISAVTIFFSSGLVQAQTQNKIDTTGFNQSQEKVKPATVRPGGLDSIGYVVGDGIVVAPTLQTEGGRDTNPNRLFDGEGSAFGRVDGGVTFGVVNEASATTLSLKGGFLHLGDLVRDDRYDAGASIDTFYQLRPGHELTAGGFYLRDEISFTKSEVLGSYGDYSFTEEHFEGFMQSRFSDVRYINGRSIAGLSPFFLNSAFDVRKYEQLGGFLFGRQSIVAAYVRGGVASIDYTDQRAETVIDRDAVDMFGVAGLRVTFSPFLRLDAGVRGNYRDLDDIVIDDVSTTGFDGALTWAPSARYQMKLAVERRLGEPSTSFSRVADVLEYSGRMVWRPLVRAELSLRAAQKESEEIGDGLTFVERSVAGEASYDVTQGVQVYLAALYERTHIEETEADFDRFRIAAGTRVQFKPNAFDPVPFDLLATATDAAHVDPWGVRQDRLIITAGYSELFLPSIDMTKRTDAFVTETVGTVEDHDGRVDGVRFDAKYRDFAAFQGRDGTLATFGVKGFYAAYERQDRSICEVDLRPGGLDCLYFNVVDPGAGDSNTGPFGQFLTHTNRDVKYWGAAVEAHIGRGHFVGGSLKDEPTPVYAPSPFKVGVAFRALQQKNELFAVDTSVPDPVDYTEDLDVYYYGPYLGYERRFALGHGFSLGIGGEAGLYYTDASYDGDYLAFIPIGANTFVTDRGTISRNRDDVSFIGSLDLDLSRDMGWGSVGLYGTVEYLSRVPKIAYRDEELDGGFPFDIAGPNKETTIDWDHAWSYTVGARISVDLHRTR